MLFLMRNEQQAVVSSAQTFAIKSSPTRTFSNFKSPCMTGCGCMEWRYSIPQTTPWARNNFFNQSTGCNKNKKKRKNF